MSNTHFGGAQVQVCDPQPKLFRKKGLVSVKIIKGDLCEVRDGIPVWIGPGMVRIFREEDCHFVEISKAMGGTL